MTEIQRINNAGWLSNRFFHPEEKCGFYISENRKMIWAVLMDLLKEFQRVCEKYQLSYFAICGTLLGTIRHKGFIPWDDDLDVAMPRADYEKLKKLRSVFKSPYSLVWPNVESENGYSFIKLRNSNTTAIPLAFSHLNINQGVFLDIFPLDDVNEATYHNDQQEIKELVIRNSFNMKSLKTTDGDKDLICKNIVATFNKIETKAQIDNGKEYSTLALRTISFYSPAQMIWNKEDFLSYIVLPFEEIDIRVPAGWRNLLAINYGEWEKMPPKEERGKWHSNVIFDSENSYIDYNFNKQSNILIDPL